MGALRTYEDSGQCRHGIHVLYVDTLRIGRLAPKRAINVVVTPSHCITGVNVRLDTT